MTKRTSNLLILMGILLLFSGFTHAQVAQITPKPLVYTAGTGEFVFDNATDIEYPDFSGDSIKTILEKFTSDFRISTGLSLTYSTNTPTAKIRLSIDNTQSPEEYKLIITTSGISITASKPAGFYYALQTIKKMMPAAVMAVQADNTVAKWAVPATNIADKPRFGWRGFMLDVGRHFFDVNEVKRVIDIMAVYKLNRFHWHLTEDQGWRIEIKKYPKLTSVGSIRKWSQIWSDPEGVYYDYIPYGPYYYTQDQIKEVVAYAKERFIEVIPEIDMPGHFQAALAAYPEYSCTPAAKHEVWVNYGVSGDVLNVGNPEAITFVKNILDELITLFPYKYIHIGGDECPTGAWQYNSQCQALLASLGSTNYRDLQTYFFKEIENYLKNKENVADRKKVIAWNETLGGDLTGSNVTIMSWTDWYNASKNAANKKLDVIMTPQIPYYINRKQSANAGEPYSQGSGSETLEAVYAFEPLPSDVTTAQTPYYKGVQGNFWTEHVFQNEVVEYLMLPRIAAIAETGWSPKAGKNFTDFVARIRPDTLLFQKKGWSYGKHYMYDKKPILPKASTAEEIHWFRLITGCTDAARTGRCIELLADGSPLIAANSTAKAGRLWSNTQAAEGTANFNYQWWCLKEDPANPGRFALVCKAVPGGSVKSTATAANNSGRWDYDNSTMYYDFVLGESTLTSGSVLYYSIRSTKHTGQYMNMAASGQQYSINLWANPLDGNGGMFSFTPFLQQEIDALKNTLQEMQKYTTYPVYSTDGEKQPGSYSALLMDEMKALMLTNAEIYSLSTTSEITELQNKWTTALNSVKASRIYPEKGNTYRIYSTKFPGAMLYATDDNKLSYTVNPQQNNIEWIVANAEPVTGENAVKIQLRNKNTLKYPGNNAPIDLTYSPYYYKASFSDSYQDFELSGETTSNKNRIFPVPEVSLENPGYILRDGVRAQGTGWKFVRTDIISRLNQDNTNSVKVYCQNKQIIIQGVGLQPVTVFDTLGKTIPYHPERKFETGIYAVRVGRNSFKVVVN